MARTSKQYPINGEKLKNIVKSKFGTIAGFSEATEITSLKNWIHRNMIPGYGRALLESQGISFSSYCVDEKTPEVADLANRLEVVEKRLHQLVCDYEIAFKALVMEVQELGEITEKIKGGGYGNVS